MTQDLCHYLTWDSEFFGLRIARLTTPLLTPETLLIAERWSREREIDCLYFLADLNHAEALKLAAEREFQLVDVRVTLERSVSTQPDTFRFVRPYRETDIPVLRELARVSHRDSRFYFDERFSREACDRLYDTWIQKSCHGWADAVLVADIGSGPVGYATAHRVSSLEGSLGLIAVHQSAQGRGLGGALVSAILDWSRSQGMEKLQVVTQGRNDAALRLYAKCGFLPRSLQLWYHRWFSTPKLNVDR